MQRFPITLRFATVGATPEVQWRHACEFDGLLRFEPPTETRPIPDELFLRKLLDVDTSVDAAVVAFLDEYGIIAREYFARSAVYVPRAAQIDLRRPLPGGTYANRVSDARWYLKSARALTRHWLAAHDGADPAPAWAEEGFAVAGLGTDMLWDLFMDHLNEGLSAFPPHVERASRLTEGLVLGRPEPGLYSGLCLQIANHLAEEAVVRHCAFCGRPFVRQLGGAEQGQYRTEGVLYCTVRCAKNQAQREYRRRRKEGAL